jgi:hypothetical protein
LTGKPFFGFPGGLVDRPALVNRPCFMYNQKKIQKAVLFGGEII